MQKPVFFDAHLQSVVLARGMVPNPPEAPSQVFGKVEVYTVETPGGNSPGVGLVRFDRSEQVVTVSNQGDVTVWAWSATTSSNQQPFTLEPSTLGRLAEGNPFNT